MSDEAKSMFRNNFLYWGLFVYVLCAFIFPTPKGGIAALQVPSFALLLLVLIQIIFPQIRFSKGANLIAVIVIITVTVLSSGVLPPISFS